MLTGDDLATVLFTSGSTGEPSAISKTLDQLDREVAALEAARDAQLKRGFQLMFSQGSDARR